MAIDPNLITTVRTGELPPLAIELTSNIAHEVDDILYRATMQELVNFIRANSSSYPYEIKYIRAPDLAYINDNFDMNPSATQGLGLVGGLWEGWAVCNGNNGTDNFDGHTLIGFGANYATVGQFLGEENHLLTIDEMPSHTHSAGSDGGTTFSSGAYFRKESENVSNLFTNATGGDEPHNNMQPSAVVLIIMKLP